MLCNQIWVMALSVCFIFTVTIGTFPAVTVEVKSTVADGGVWGESAHLKSPQSCTAEVVSATEMLIIPYLSGMTARVLPLLRHLLVWEDC